MDKSKVSKNTFYKIKDDENVTVGILLRICDILQFDISEIVECVSIDDGGKTGV
jgi:conserved domain protein